MQGFAPHPSVCATASQKEPVLWKPDFKEVDEMGTGIHHAATLQHPHAQLLI